jgi:hypothetical protein
MAFGEAEGLLSGERGQKRTRNEKRDRCALPILGAMTGNGWLGRKPTSD